jgi:hypothetical protein
VGQCKSTAEHGATSQRVRVQREAARSASGHGRCSKSKDGARSRAWEEAHAAAAAALTGQRANQGATSDPGRKSLCLGNVRERAWGDGPGVRCAGACSGKVRVAEAAARVSSLGLMAPTGP